VSDFLALCGTGRGVSGVAGGASVLLGNRHRAVVDATYGLLGRFDYGAGASRVVYAFTLGAGYEYMSDIGVTFRPMFGLTIPTGALADFGPTLNVSIGIGFKVL
jgi:hypothetical protein